MLSLRCAANRREVRPNLYPIIIDASSRMLKRAVDYLSSANGMALH